MKKIFIYTLIACCCLMSCKKYLDKKQNITLNIPTSLDDLQRILDNDDLLDFSIPGLNDIGADNYYLPSPPQPDVFHTTSTIVQNSYIWASDIWAGGDGYDWNSLYGNIYKCNVVLDGLKDFNPASPNEIAQFNSIEGKALFIRATEHYFLEECFGQPYKPATSNGDLGIPLKLSSDLLAIAKRSTVQETYNQILSDLTQAAKLVPAITATRNKPSKAAVFAMLAKVYLTMQDYSNAKQSADSSLSYNNFLYQYSDLNSGLANPFLNFTPPNDMPEILFPFFQISYGVFSKNTVVPDTTLFNSYDNNDLRKKVFFRFIAATSNNAFKGSYSGNSARIFAGPAVDEVYLTRAECLARGGDKSAAMNDLNTLLRTRWAKLSSGVSLYVDQTANDADEALRIILNERRKELVLRATRWIDLRRLNQDPRFAITLTRNVAGQIYTLPPNDKKYVYPIPDNEIRLSGLQQNPR